MFKDAVDSDDMPLNIILFGETGSGKSSMINLLAGKEVARTSPDIDGCTTACTPYPFIVDDVSYTIWDTVGLDEPMMGDTGYLRAIEQVCKLVRDLTRAGGVNLLLFCHRQGRISTTTQKNYALLYEAACQKAVPIAAVITFLEQEKRMEDWWDQNSEVFARRGMEFCGHACVTTLLEEPKIQESREAIERILKICDRNGRQRMPAKMEVKGEDLVQILRERCGVRRGDDAHRVAEILMD